MPDLERKRIVLSGWQGGVLHGRAAALVGLLFALVGGFVVLAATDVIPVDDVEIHAPRWVVGVVGAIFFVVGGWLTALGIWGWIRRVQIDSLQELHPLSPWKWDYPWNVSGRGDDNLVRAVKSILATAFLALFVAPFNWVGFVSKGKPLSFQVFAAVADLAVVGLLVWTVYKFLQALKYGRVRLAWTRLPFFLGTRLELRVVFNTPLAAFQRITCRLRFVEERYETRRTKNGRSTSLAHYQLYGDEQVFANPGELSGFELPLSFDLPEEGRPTSLSEHPASYWHLEVEASAPGIDFSACWPLPIYLEPVRARAPVGCVDTVKQRFLATPMPVHG